MSISRFASSNDKYFFILVSIDILLKYAMGCALQRKEGSEVTHALEEIFSIRKPLQISLDRGTEFKSFHVQNMLREKGIRHFLHLINALLLRDSFSHIDFA